MEIDFKLIEEKWQKRWEAKRVFEAKENSKIPNYYVLEMFPYPSGSGLHMGHAWNYTIGDILARFKLMNGFNVLHPMGYDSLGLPAENAAIEAGTHPADYNKKSITNYIKQQKALGLTYDWSRMISTDNPEFYKWDQWIFLKMLEKGLAYQKESAVNWCPKCNTVLANEQVVDGKCWRHDGTNIETKHLNQWFFKITNYADELYEGIKNLDWPERTKTMQKYWIGKSYGTEIDFEVGGEKWPVFTTRPDTIFGVTFVVVSAQHKKLWDLVKDKQKKEVEKFLKTVKSVSEKEMAEMEKEGVFTGSYAINPVNGEKVPIYVGNFVVADYGSGMVMAVPAHDKRDFAFAKKYGVPIKVVIDPKDFEIDSKKITEAYVEGGTLINSGEFDGLENDEAKKKITKFLEKKSLGREVINFRLRDWGISRQRYWGTPIPIIHCGDCGAVPVPEKDLPIELPKKVKFGKGNPLLTNAEWLNVPCPKCGKNAKREADTMDTFVNSSWYFMRYCDSKNKKAIFSKDKISKWCPVDSYVGGAEHACMHLIYSRFYTKFLRDLGLVEFDEPFKKVFHQGMLHAEDGSKMSKSKGNVVLPEVVSGKYGIDTARFFLSSLASPDKDIDWNEKGIIGSKRFIAKIFDFYDENMNGAARRTHKALNSGSYSEKLEAKLNNVIKNVTGYYDNFKYRKATIELRELFDLMHLEKKVSKKAFEDFLKLLNPICPHITEELWEKLGNKKFISNSSWPKYNEKKLKILNKEIDVNSKVIENVFETIKRVEEKGKKISKVYLYVLPFEISKYQIPKLKKALGKEIILYSVKDDEKHDPENKSKKARPGMPGIYFE
ncbi:leucine--tRNA ligase [archaeon]|jgi:leucyl-tRNA synthetase|nr:leucine--tRNA ligase [archaeon]